MGGILLGTTDFVVIGMMLVISASMGLYFRFTGGRQKTTQEFLMAGRNMSVMPVAFSLMATYMSAVSILGVPAETYMYGTQFGAWVLGMPIGGLIAAYGFIPVFFDLNVSTAYEYLEKRFGKTTRTVASLLFTVQMVLYMAVVLYAPSLALNAVTGLATWASVVSLAVVCTFYCSLGGLKAVLWTDVFQSFLMYFTIISVVVSINTRLGFTKVYDIAKDGGRLIFLNTSPDFTQRYTLWNSVATGFMFSLKTFGTNQAQIQRLMSTGNLKKAQNALFLSFLLILIYIVFNFWDGVVIYAMYHDCDPVKEKNSPLTSPDQIMAFVIMKLFGSSPGLAGLAIAGVFSASLSTISSAVNSLTAVTMEDFIRPYCFCKRLTESWATILAKLLAVGYGVITLFLTYIVANFRGVIEASNIMYGMIAGPILGIYVLGMFTKTANEKGTLVGLLVGFSINAWLGFGSYAVKPPVQALIRSTAGCSTFQNTTLLNTSSLLNATSATVLEIQNAVEVQERYIFPLYRISFLWFPFIGCGGVIFTGYMASFLLSYWINSPEVDLEYLSPFIRRFYSKSVDFKGTDETNHPQIEMKMRSLRNQDNQQTNGIIQQS